jgi:alpha-ketoglutarate-dependent 2,4-dichlorophenoxyacetate dioxygenase
LKPEEYQMGRHHITQIHEPSGRINLYIGAHLHHIEGLSPERSDELRDMLNKHAAQNKYVVSVEWHGPGDMIIWDNRAVLHRACGGSFEGKYKRDLRRTTVHDASSTAWGLNEKTTKAPGFNPDAMKAGISPEVTARSDVK